MATLTITAAEGGVKPLQTKDIATRLLDGTLHSQWPPFEQFATIDGLLKSHAAQPDEARRPLICYPVREAADFEEHTAGAIDRYTDLAVRYYMQQGLIPADPSLEQAPVVAMLAGSSFEVVVTFFALNRLGYAVLFLSTRLTAPAYTRLMEMANCSQIIETKQFQQVVTEICSGRPGCSTFPLLQREDWFNRPVSTPLFERLGADPSREGKKIAWILHSSGSTGFPKPIFLTNLQTLANFCKSFGLRLFTTSPLFHSHALMEFGRAFYTRAPAYLGNHSLPVTYQNLFDALQVAKPQQISAVPYVIKLLAEKQEGIQALARPQLVLYGGSSCPDDLGDRLVAQGVNLVGNYGATETGQIMTSFRAPEDKEWQYMRLHRPVADLTLMDEISPGVFECVALDGLPSKGPSNSKPPYSAKNPENSFRTADLFTKHPDPEKSNYYKYLSRLDDRITLVNGEKVLPIPIEGRVREEPIVSDCVVFGFQRTVPGALIFRAPGKVPHLSDDEFLEAIWPAVEAANARAETFSRIPKELVVIKGSDVVYARTDKGTCIRAQVYQQFEEDIKQAYAKFEGGGQKRGSLALNIPELEDWLVSRFSEDLGVLIPGAEADIFSAGVDSLQTTQIWRCIMRDIDIGDGGDQLSQNIVFEKGTVNALAKHLYQLRTGQEFEREDELHSMREMIQKYSHFTQHFPTMARSPETEVVMVTGATGNLGAFIVAELLKRPTVSEVWAILRAPGQAAAGARLYKALADRNIVLTHTEAAKLHAVPGDMSQSNLGLKDHDLQHLLSCLTCVIHSAWAVNFNLGVRSFEQHHIRGTYNLINLCLRSRLPSPARFFFCSSVSAAGNTPKPALVPETIVENLEHGQKTGYGRSKLVTEHITRNAMHQTGMQARVLRIGQLGGDTISAQWNDTEAVALMFRSALTTGALPELNERPSWLPVDQCGRAISDIAMNVSGSTDPNMVYHLVNPRTFSWKDDLLPALRRGSALAEFEVVSPQDWLSRLATSEQDPQKNPSVKLIDFWTSKYASHSLSETGPGRNEEAGLTFETERTVEDCPSLGFVEDPVGSGLIRRYIESWMNLYGKVYVVTGANSGIGKDIARLLYAKNAKVYVLCRSEDKALEAIQDIEKTFPDSNGALIFIACDLADLTNVKTAADAFLAREQRLDVLFNNAGVMVGPGEPGEPIPVTAQGHELCLGVNCVATHLLTKLLTPTLVATDGLTRIVWYSSFGMEIGAQRDVGIATDNLDYHKPEKETQRYIVSKTGAWALGIEHNRHYKAQGVASVPIDPGNVVSGLPRDQALQLRIVAKLVCYPTVYGAYTALYAGFSPEVVSDQADWTKEWVAPFGRMFPLRSDLTKATLLEEDGGNGGTAKFWNWCEEQIKEYL